MSLFNMCRRHRYRAGLLGALLLAFTAAPVAADQWNERTVMKFSEPVMVPGATLQPGTYIFRLVDPDTAMHTVEIRKEGEAPIALVQAVPMKRMDAKGDIVVKFNPTEAGSPPAMKGWFYPGSLYGHEFVYSDEEARKIAERTKTIVLSRDVSNSDMQKGTLRTYDANGVTRNWVPDQAAAASWESWRKNRHTTATAVTEPSTGERAKSNAPMIQANREGVRVTLDQLEDNATNYIGKTVSVDAEVEEVLGPRVFKIDERNWADLEGELLVYVPSPLAAIVRENDRVTVTGEVKRFIAADFQNEWGWLGLDNAMEVKLGKRPVLVATNIVGGDNQTVLVVNVDKQGQGAMTGAANQTRSGGTGTGSNPATTTTGSGTSTTGATGTSGTIGRTTPDTAGTSGAGMRALTDVSSLGMAGVTMVGRTVDLDNIRVEAVGDGHGIFARAGNQTVFILPTVGERPGVSKGETISVEGTILQMPRVMKDRLQSTAGVTSFNDAIYVYATNVQR
jgi:hypothetical protein